MSKAEFNGENILMVAVQGVTEEELTALRDLAVRDKEYWETQTADVDVGNRERAETRVARENTKIQQIDDYIVANF